MPCFFQPSAIPSKVSPSAAKFCARNSTPWPATPRAHCSPGTAAPTRPTPRKSSRAVLIICDLLMTSNFWFRLIALLVAAALGVAVVQAWRADRRERAQLEAELAATKQLLSAADARQHDRDAQLAQTLATLAAEKRIIVTPAQILRELPSQISLPSPIALQPVPALPNSPTPQTNAVIPAEDLKP